MASHDSPTGGHGHGSGSRDAADSAGQPWAGRSFEENAFTGDDGTTPPAFADAVSAWLATDPESAARAEALSRVVHLIPATRFLIPLVAVAGEEGRTESGLKVDKTQELSVVSVAGPEGQRVLPVFTNVATMTAWRSEARPVPADGQRVALAAVADDCVWLVVDPGSQGEMVVRRPALRAIAQGLEWVPPYADPDLDRIFQAPLSAVAGARGVDLVSGDPLARGVGEELIVRVILAPLMSHDEMMTCVQELSRAWAAEPTLSDRIDSMRVQVIPGEGSAG